MRSPILAVKLHTALEIDSTVPAGWLSKELVCWRDDSLSRVINFDKTDKVIYSLSIAMGADKHLFFRNSALH